MTAVNNDSTTDQIEADRIALNNMFRAIAEYGRRVRLRRQAECSAPVHEEAQIDPPVDATRVKRKRRKRTD